MKVIHFIPSLDQKTGGTAFYIQSLASELGKHVELYIVTKKTKTPVYIENVNVIFLDLRISNMLFLYKRFQIVIDEINPDIIHINVIWMPQSYIIHKVAIKNKIKVVLSPHGMTEPWILNRNKIKKKIARLLYQNESLKKADFIHVTANSEKENFVKLDLNSNVKVIPNGIEVDNITIKNNWKIKRRILFLSRIHVKKGVEIFIDTVFQLREQLDEYEIIIAGEGDIAYVETLKKLVSDKGMNNKIQFLGGVYGKAKFDLFRNSDFFVLPTFSENFGIVIAEALAAGTPVITTKGTPWEVLDLNNCGNCIEVGVEPLKDALLSATKKNEDDIKIMGMNGRKLIEENYSSTIIGLKMFLWYKEIIALN